MRIIAEFLEDSARIDTQSDDHLPSAHADLADALRQFLNDHRKLMQVADSWRSEFIR